MRNRENNQNCSGNEKQKRPKSYDLDLKLGYKDSNLEMTESESVALPFGDTPMFVQLTRHYYTHLTTKIKYKF